MDKLQKKFTIGGIIVIILLSLIWLKNVNVTVNTEKVNLPDIGSVQRSGEYQFTKIDSSTATGSLIIKSSAGTLGSIVVASSSASAITIYNASTATDTSSTTLGTMRASIGEGTYTFDSIFTRGIIINVPTGFTGSYIVTYR